MTNLTQAEAKRTAGIGLHEKGRLLEAKALYLEALQLTPGDFATLRLLGLAVAQSGDPAQAAQYFAEAIAVNSRDAEVHFQLALSFHQLNRLAEALAGYERVISLEPSFAEAHGNRGVALYALGRHAEALQAYDKALALKPDFIDAYFGRGVALRTLGRYQDAEPDFARVLQINPQHPEASRQRALTLDDLGRHLMQLGRHEEALASFDKGLAVAPAIPELHYNKGIVLQLLGRVSEAASSFARAADLKPDFSEAHHDLGAARQLLGQIDAALASYDRAIALRPGYARAYLNRGGALQEMKRHAEAINDYARAHQLDPNLPFVKGELLHAKMVCCEWSGLDALHTQIHADVMAGKRSATPFGYLGISNSEAEQRAIAEIYARDKFPEGKRPVAAGSARERGAKIRVGYLCGDFRNQATSVLMAEVYERHDKSRFEIVALDNGYNDGSAMRGRLEKAFDRIVDITRMPDRTVAELIAREGIDILINLNGYFGKGRNGVFHLKPCPVQVNYLGFPNTMGVPFMDYLIADRTVIPEASRQHYSESIVYLPHTYQPNDRQREIAGKLFSRTELGLPAEGFVFCCFNNNFKITPEVFTVWMNLLKKVGGSVLWLLENTSGVAANLRREAQACGVDPARVIFAGRAALPDHLARHRCADIFLDTIPCNAHTTASDALWAGLPVLTCRGNTFAGRVAASLLQADGLPELITGNLADYEQLAFSLATQPDRLAQIRAKVEANRLTTPLFDSETFTRHLEQAYVHMHERAGNGLPPESFAVAP